MIGKQLGTDKPATLNKLNDLRQFFRDGALPPSSILRMWPFLTSKSHIQFIYDGLGRRLNLYSALLLCVIYTETSQYY